MDELLYTVISDGVRRYLDAVDALAASQRQPASTELRRLAAAWRALLGMHRPGGRRARCVGCGRRHGGRLRATPMCTAWRVASAYFVRRLPVERDGVARG